MSDQTIEHRNAFRNARGQFAPKSTVPIAPDSVCKKPPRLASENRRDIVSENRSQTSDRSTNRFAAERNYCPVFTAEPQSPILRAYRWSRQPDAPLLLGLAIFAGVLLGIALWGLA